VQGKAELFLAEQDVLIGVFVACWMAAVAIETQLVGTFQGLDKIGLAVLCDGALAKLFAMAAVVILYFSRGHMRACMRCYLFSSPPSSQMSRLRCFMRRR
jgi:hypothetical protein